MEGPIDAVRAKQPEQLPAVLTKEEVRIDNLQQLHITMSTHRFNQATELQARLARRQELSQESLA